MRFGRLSRTTSPTPRLCQVPNQRNSVPKMPTPATCFSLFARHYGGWIERSDLAADIQALADILAPRIRERPGPSFARSWSSGDAGSKCAATGKRSPSA